VLAFSLSSESRLEFRAAVERERSEEAKQKAEAVRLGHGKGLIRSRNEHENQFTM
jgi:hypothetical protein